MGPSTGVCMGGVHVQGVDTGGVCIWRLREYTVFESLRTALVITLHHKYVQLSGGNRALPTCSRIGVVITLVLKLWSSIIVAATNMRV